MKKVGLDMDVSDLVNPVAVAPPMVKPGAASHEGEEFSAIFAQLVVGLTTQNNADDPVMDGPEPEGEDQEISLDEVDVEIDAPEPELVTADLVKPLDTVATAQAAQTTAPARPTKEGGMSVHSVPQNKRILNVEQAGVQTAVESVLRAASSPHAAAAVPQAVPTAISLVNNSATLSAVDKKRPNVPASPSVQGVEKQVRREKSVQTDRPMHRSLNVPVAPTNASYSAAQPLQFMSIPQEPHYQPSDAPLRSVEVAPTSGTTASPVMLSQSNGPQPPVHQQLAIAISRINAAQTELTLRPAELGRVQITLQTTDTGIVVQMTAERAETLDLMRRHSDDLARDLAAMGFDDIGFSFSEDDTSDDDGAGRETSDIDDVSMSPLMGDEAPTNQDQIISLTGLDLRL